MREFAVPAFTLSMTKTSKKRVADDSDEENCEGEFEETPKKTSRAKSRSSASKKKNEDESDDDDDDSPRKKSAAKSKAKASPKAKAKSKASNSKNADEEKPAPKRTSRASKKAKDESDNEEDGDDFEKLAASAKMRLRQRHPVPPNGDGTRAYYESLLEEFPECPMAVKFCVEYGVLTGTKKNHYEALYDLYKQHGFTKLTGHNVPGVTAAMIKKQMELNFKVEAKHEQFKNEVKSEY